MSFITEKPKLHLLDLEMADTDIIPLIDGTAPNSMRGTSTATDISRNSRSVASIWYVIVWTTPIITGLLWIMYSHVKQFLGDEGDIGYKFVVGMTLGSISSLIGWEAPRLFEMHVAKLQPAERLMLVTVLTCIWQVVMLIVGTVHAKS